MSEIKDKVREDIAEKMYVGTDVSSLSNVWETVPLSYKRRFYSAVEAILSIPRLAIVDREAECMLRDSARKDRCVFLGYNCKGEKNCVIYHEFEEAGWVKEVKE